MPTTYDVSLLVIDSLYDQASGQDVAFACFQVDFVVHRTKYDNMSREGLYELEKGAQ